MKRKKPPSLFGVVLATLFVAGVWLALWLTHHDRLYAIFMAPVVVLALGWWSLVRGVMERRNADGS